MELRVGKPGLDFGTEHITLGPLVSASIESGKQPPLFFSDCRQRLQSALLNIHPTTFPVYVPILQRWES